MPWLQGPLLAVGAQTLRAPWTRQLCLGPTAVPAPSPGLCSVRRHLGASQGIWDLTNRKPFGSNQPCPTKRESFKTGSDTQPSGDALLSRGRWGGQGRPLCTALRRGVQAPGATAPIRSARCSGSPEVPWVGPPAGVSWGSSCSEAAASQEGSRVNSVSFFWKAWPRLVRPEGPSRSSFTAQGALVRRVGWAAGWGTWGRGVGGLGIKRGGSLARDRRACLQTSHPHACAGMIHRQGVARRMQACSPAHLC